MLLEIYVGWYNGIQLQFNRQRYKVMPTLN